MIKLVATDIDGTILGKSGEFTQGVKDCIKTLQEKDIKVVIVTGRMHAGAKKIAKRLNLTTPVVSYQGGLIKDIDGTVLYEKFLPENIAKEMGGRAEVKFLCEYPVVENSEQEALELQRLAKNVVSNVNTTYQTTASEDFSYYLEKVPGVMMHVGCQQDVYYPQHSEGFCVGENPMLIGTQMFYEIVKHYLI